MDLPAVRSEPAGPFMAISSWAFCLAMPQQTNYHDAVGNCRYFRVLNPAAYLAILVFIDVLARLEARRSRGEGFIV